MAKAIAKILYRKAYSEKNEFVKYHGRTRLLHTLVQNKVLFVCLGQNCGKKETETGKIII